MEVFFDTEFTTADKNVGFPALISVGCAAQNGSTFYAELSDTWHPGTLNDPKIGNWQHALLLEMIDYSFFANAIEQAFQNHVPRLRRHHALDDAKANRLAWLNSQK